MLVCVQSVLSLGLYLHEYLHSPLHIWALFVFCNLWCEIWTNFHFHSKPHRYIGLSCPGIRVSQRLESSVSAPPGGGWSEATPGLASNKEIIAYKYILSTRRGVPAFIWTNYTIIVCTERWALRSEICNYFKPTSDLEVGTRQTNTVGGELTHWEALLKYCYQILSASQCVLFDLFCGRRALGPPRAVFLNSPDWTNYWRGRATLFPLATLVPVFHWKYTQFHSNWLLFQCSNQKNISQPPNTNLNLLIKSRLRGRLSGILYSNLFP